MARRFILFLSLRSAIIILFMMMMPLAHAFADFYPSDADCANAKVELREFITSQPVNCTQDSDCDGFYYDDGDSCDKPYVLPKSHQTKEFLDRLMKMQEAVRSGCANEPPSPACEPMPFTALCHQGQCINGMHSD